MQTSGTIVTPNYAGVSGFLGLAGPTFGQNISLATSTSSGTVGNVIVSGTGVAGAPAQSYYIQLAYSGPGTNLSLPGTEFIVNCAAGITPAVQVSTAGPYAIAASKFAPYVGFYSGGEALQASTVTATATGAFFDIKNPLQNFTGAFQAPSNVSASILGLSIQDSAALYATGVGGSTTAGGLNNKIGVWGNPSPLGPPDPLQVLVAAVSNGQPVEICLKQSWSPLLIGASCGITLDGPSGYHVADTAAAATATIMRSAGAVNENVGDINTRVLITFTAANVL